MSQRRFTDSRGKEWYAYIVVVTPGAAIMEPAFSHHVRKTKTYLAFDSAGERRRLSPFPIEWEDARLEELERLLGLATVTNRSASL
ncbi:MAG TPA: hypothetical protein VJO33_13385 [Gemmatimonadaceae bacterium]|nr:hypothetical protein [Gemmatimonadaceae bacterium]